MNGYKTGGDWTDVTSVGRNEIVFEGRHQAYGAFYIRQRYPNALLFSLLSSIGFMVVCALIPYLLKVHIPIPKPIPDVVIKPTDLFVVKRTIIKPTAHPEIHPPKNNTSQNALPIITTDQRADTETTKKSSEPSVPTQTAGTESEGESNSPGNMPGNPPPVPDDNKAVIFASTMPKFPGGKIDDYLAQKLQYPAEEARLGIQGTAYVSFIIERDGSVSSVKLERGISNGQDLNQEALRVLSEMPKWIPGNQDGHPVRVQYVVPIHFKLQ